MINEGTIIANSSASGTAAISLLRLSGENAIDLVTSSFIWEEFIMMELKLTKFW